MLHALVARIAGSVVERHLFFLAATSFTILFTGYHFGTFDQVIHIPFLKKYADPSLFPGDQFLDLRFQHYSYFWFIFQPFYRIGILEVAMFVTHFLATYVTFWALWALSETLFHNPITGLISAVAFAFPHIGFGGWPVFEFSPLNRTFVLPFLLFAIILFLRQHYLAAFAVLGAMYNLHVLSANFVLAMFMFDCIIERKKIGWQNIVGGMILFVITALPVLVWKFSSPPVNFSLRPEWFSILVQSSHFNLFYLVAPSPLILLATTSGAGALALFFIARRYTPANEHDQTMTNFVYALLLILAAQVVTAQWLPIAIIIELQIIRAGIFVLIFAYLFFANYLANCYQSRSSSNFDLNLLIGAYVFSALVFVPAVIWAIQHWFVSLRWQRFASIGAMLTMSVYAFTLALRLNLWYPGIYIFPHNTAWYDVQIWARDHTSKETVFITPLAMWWLYESDWRVFSERSTVVVYSDLLEASVVLEYIDIWKPRFEALAPGALNRFRGNVIENLEITAQAFSSLSADDLVRIGRQYGASYFVSEKPRRHDFKVVYENERFIVYQLPAEAASFSDY